MKGYDCTEQEFVDCIYDVLDDGLDAVADLIKEFFPQIPYKAACRQAEWFMSRMDRVPHYTAEENIGQAEHTATTSLYRTLKRATERG